MKTTIKTWNKLVRDNIPNSLAEKGILSHVHIVSSKYELIQMLFEKGHEESKEVQEAITMMQDISDTKNITEEVADLYEVRRGMNHIYKTIDKSKEIWGQMKTIKNIIINTLKKYNIPERIMISTANKKRKIKGGFFKGIFLHNTIEYNNA